MKHFVTSGSVALFSILAFSPLATGVFAKEGVDYNSSRSNKSGVMAPSDTSDDGAMGEADPQGMAINEKGLPSKKKKSSSSARMGGGSEVCNPCPESLDGSSDAQGITIDEAGTEKGKGGSTRKTVVLPHVLEKSGVKAVDIESEDPQPQGMAINEKGLPGEKGTKDKKSAK